MILSTWPNRIWKTTERSRIIILCFILAEICWLVPIQRQFAMGRYQHYAIVLGIFGLGYFAQVAVSWQRLSFWLRLSIIVTGIFLDTIAMVMWNNPWLDWSIAVQTEEREQFRSQLIIDYVVGVSLVALCWIKWSFEVANAKRRFAAKESGGAQK